VGRRQIKRGKQQERTGPNAERRIRVIGTTRNGLQRYRAQRQHVGRLRTGRRQARRNVGVDRRWHRRDGARAIGGGQRMNLRRRIAHRQRLRRLLRRRQNGAGPRRGPRRKDHGRRRRNRLCRGFGGRRLVRRRRHKGGLGLVCCGGCGRSDRCLRLRLLLFAFGPVPGIKAGIARTESGGAAVDRRRADTAWRYERSGRRRLIRGGDGIAGPAKARRIVWISVEGGLQQAGVRVWDTPRRLRRARCRHQ
jgi:hypothetical protein